MESYKLFSRLASNCNPPDLYPPSSWDYSHVCYCLYTVVLSAAFLLIIGKVKFDFA
jgi:hypothetical protein